MSDVSGAADAPAPTTEAPDTPETQKPAQSLSEAVKGSSSAPKPPGAAPWSKDLEGMGLDPETLAKVDAYMRSTVQPHTTQLEQKASEFEKMFGEFTTNDGNALDPSTAAQMASELLNALATDPEAAVRDIMKLMQLDPSKFAQVQEEMKEQAEESPEEIPPELSWVQEQMQRDQWSKEDAAWKEHLDALRAQNDGHFAEKLYTLAMAGTGPEAETAMQWYQDAVAEVEAMIAAKNAPKETAPATLGEGHPTPPETPEYGSIADAVKGFAADMRAGRG